MGKKKSAAASSPRALRARGRDLKIKVNVDSAVEQLTAATARNLQKTQSTDFLAAMHKLEQSGRKHPGMDIAALAFNPSTGYWYNCFAGPSASQEAVAAAITQAIFESLSQANGLTDAARRTYENPKLKDDVSSALGDLLATAMQRGVIGSQQAQQLTKLWSDMQKAKRGEMNARHHAAWRDLKDVTAIRYCNVRVVGALSIDSPSPSVFSWALR